jgi:CRISPR type III-A-associated RAMP protein Csm4
MRPGLVVKLRPSGPWRIGPDSGARNRVDVIYHSDSLYAAVTSAMGRVGLLEEWLQATVREPAPAVCFSSCFPFLNEIGMVVPPRTVWPPRATSLASARVRWKSARFVPLDVVRAILAGEPMKEDDWTVDGPSECLVPTGRPGPFRTGVRWNAAVDRLTGASERHATACIEFRPGAGLWTIAGFRDEPSHARWLEPVKAAFRLLADTGFGGERSRGWGRSEQPEFIEGSLPEMILPAGAAIEEEGGREQESGGRGPGASRVGEHGGQGVELAPEPELLSVPIGESPMEPSPVPPIQDPPVEPQPGPDPELPPPDPDPEPPAPEPDPPMLDPPFPEPEPMTATAEPVVAAAAAEPEAAAATASESEPPLLLASGPQPILLDSGPQPLLLAAAEPEPVAREAGADEKDPDAEPVAPPSPVPAEPEPLEDPEPMTHAAVTMDAVAPLPLADVRPPSPAPVLSNARGPRPPAPEKPPASVPVWLLSLFTPAAADAVDWRRGNYTVLARGGRVDSPAGSGELKKQLQMVVEGSVLYAEGDPHGAAPDVAPEGFAHPVFRAGFALAIPLPEVS